MTAMPTMPATLTIERTAWLVEDGDADFALTLEYGDWGEGPELSDVTAVLTAWRDDEGVPHDGAQTAALHGYRVVAAAEARVAGGFDNSDLAQALGRSW